VTIKVEVPRIRPHLGTPHGIVPLLMVYRRAHKENEIDENCEPVLSEPKAATQLRVTLTIDGTNP
jgi:hypothetical protein